MPSLPPEGTAATATVRYRDRQSGALCAEAVPAERWLRWLYGSRLGSAVGTALFGRRWASALAGCWQRSGWSRRQIRPFAARYGVELDEAERAVTAYQSFNDFFTRRLRPGARPFTADPKVLCAPADGRALVFPCLDTGTEMPLKGDRLSAPSLLAGASAGNGDRFVGGCALVVRLAPSDYHRFHFCDSGTAATAVPVRGRLDSVNPLALGRRPGVLAGNQRTVTAVQTTGFGLAMQVEVGAFAVGSIVQTYAPGRVERGQEKGFFQFGGSSVVLLFEAGAVTFDEDLVRDSAAGLEVRVHAGEQVGRSGLG